MRRGRRGGPIGVVLVDKPAGPTSAEVVDWLRWSLRGTAVGHCGTLDPAATGLLVCCVGAATKLAPYLTEDDKHYRATIQLGRSTTTADAAGDTLEESEVGPQHVEAAGAALADLVGEHALAPPAYSAIKVDGERAYARAREGEQVSLEPRSMKVLAVDNIQIDGTAFTVTATLHVSKGTYIRSLAEEVGRRAGVPAHLAVLRRTQCGPLKVTDARIVSGFDVQPRPPTPEGKPRHRLRLEAVADDRAVQGDTVRASVFDPAEALSMPKLVLVDDELGRDMIRRLGQGQTIRPDHPEARELPLGLAAVVCEHPPALILVEVIEAGNGASGALLKPHRLVVGSPAAGAPLA